MEVPAVSEGAAPGAASDANALGASSENEIVILSEPNSPAKPSQDQASATQPAKAKTPDAAAPLQQTGPASNGGSGKKRSRQSKKSLEAAAVGTKQLSAFLVTPNKKPKTEEGCTPATNAATPPQTAPQESEAKSTPEPVAKQVSEGSACRLLVDGAFVRAKVVAADNAKNQVCVKLDGSEEQRWVAVDSQDLTICNATPMSLDMEVDKSDAATTSEGASKGDTVAAEPECMVIDEEGGSAETNEPGSDSAPAATTPSSASEKEKAKQVSAEAAKTPSTVKKVTKAPKKAVMSASEREKANERLQEELLLLSKMKFAVPYLLPTDQELSDELDCATVCDREQAVPMKTRQVVARFVEGGSRSREELAAALLEKASNRPEDTAPVVRRLEEIVCMVAEPLQFCPAGEGGLEESCKWSVRDMADMPAEFRGLVEAQHKMQAAVRDRMLHVQKMLGEECAKERGRLDKALLAMKDRFVKLEEKEKKERERLVGRMEKEKEKSEAKLEKERERLEAERRKRDEKMRRKEEEARAKKEKEAKEKEAKKAEEDAKKADKADDEVKPEKPEKPKQGGGKAKAEKGKSESTVKQASFMANFFKKAPAPAAPKPAGPAAEASAAKTERAGREEGGGTGCTFAPWEPAKNSVVAPLPWGPGRGDAPAGPSPEGTDLGSWLTELRRQPARRRACRPVREDGREHPKMKLIQLNMKLPLVRTQLLDVDVDAPQKIVWDVEEDNAEEKLGEILAECDEQADGLYRYRGRTLEMRMEGGGWFDCRRPPFCGTFRRASALVSGRNPLAQDPELDYTYESDVDWESEAGDGEDLGSDLDGDEEEEEMEDDEGGFVVPDGMVMDEEDADGGVATVRRLRKLQQVVYYGEAVPEEVGAALGVQLVEAMPLILENDDNIVIEREADYYGEDLGSQRAANVEQAILAMQKHPLACAFTFIPAESGHRFAGVVFLKGRNAQDHRQAGEGLVSGYIKEVPKKKRIAIRNAAEEEAAEAAAAAAERAKAQKKAPEPKSKRLAKKLEAEAAEHAAEQQAAAAEDAAARLAAAALDHTKPEKAKAKAAVDKAAAAKIAIPDQQLLRLVKLAHGSAKSKAELVREFLEHFPEVAQSRAGRYVNGLFTKKEGRLAIAEERLSNPFVAEVAADAWKANSGAGGAPAGQMTLKAMPKPLSA